ncbi:exported hypothetical protein [Arthrobacter sp. 8AJ]|nr:exported hypothetical protein [Arthrobacter sp. 8AJ]
MTRPPAVMAVALTLHPVMVWSLTPQQTVANPLAVPEDYPLPNAGITSSRYSLFTWGLPPVRQVKGLGEAEKIRYRGNRVPGKR